MCSFFPPFTTCAEEPVNTLTAEMNELTVPTEKWHDVTSAQERNGTKENA